VKRSITAPSSVGLALVLALAACGGGETGAAHPTAPANPDLTVVGVDIKYDKTEYQAKAGSVKIAFVNQGKQTHALVIEGTDKKKVGTRLQIDPGDSTGETYELAAGTYAMYCDIPGHRQSMNAKLVVS
jgi:plastocyanin